MKGTKELKTSKGITLIALVITIIVMLILVSVTISMAVNGGLFEKTGEAVQGTQNAIEQEQALSDGRIKVGEYWYDSIDAYLQGNPSDTQDFDYTDFTVTASNRAKIGYTGKEGENLVIPKYFKDTDGKYYRVTGIGDSAFMLCSNLLSVSIPNSVTTLEPAAFAGCSNLSGTFTVPGGVTVLNRDVVSDTNITNLILSEGITSIANTSLYVGVSLKTITIPKSLTTIEDGAIANYCSNLTDIYYAGTETEWNAISIGSDNGSLTSATMHYGE